MEESSERRTPLVEFGLRNRYLFGALVDAVLLAAGLAAAVVLRFEFDLADADWIEVAAFAPLVGLVQLTVGLFTGLYVGRTRYGSFDEFAVLATSMGITVVTVSVLNVGVLDRLVPMSIPFGMGAIALLLACGVRYSWRASLERQRRPDADTSERVLVFGAGEGGAQVITAMLRDPESPYYPVGLLDDSAAKRHLEISGVRVVGTRADIAEAAEMLDASTLIIAAPTLDRVTMRDIATAATGAGLKTMSLPPLDQLLGAGIGVDDIRALSEEDLLGRGQVDTDVDAIADYLSAKRVLVTGAGGSIGSELCRQIFRFGPAALIMVERDETALHAVQLSIDGRGQLDDPNLVVADIRDRNRISEVFAHHHPDVVFHAAALKHVPLLEMHPDEAYKTNVEGTRNVLDAACAVEVERFVNISTDKAADPVNVLGHTKLEAERLTAEAAARCDGTFLSVRFGNVLGSRGSVLTSFREQIEAGGPVTVTDPDVTRYFMTVGEAVQLVIQAGAIGHDGDSLVLDMGEPVRIADVAQRLVDQADRPVQIVYTGLRQGEKLHEVLLGDNETGHPTDHPLISRVTVTNAFSTDR